jgi:chaperone BCS1
METLFNQITALLQEQLASNQFLSGGFILMVLGAAAALCRNVPARIWSWITHRAFLEFEIPMKDDSFNWFNDWLAAQSYSKNWARWLTVRTVRRTKRSLGGLEYYDDDDDGRPAGDRYDIILSPAPGRHWLFWKGYFIIVDRDRKENENGGNGGASSSVFSVPRETFNVSILTWHRKVMIDLLEAARDFANPPEDKRISVFVPRYGDWVCDMKRRPRSVESVVCRTGVMESLMEDAQTFLGRETWYTERGIPFRRGYMLHGPPGNGKSSAVAAVASALNLDIYVVNLGTSSLGDDELRSLFSRVPTNTIVLIEDIDCVFRKRSSTKDNDSKVTFSGLLNAIDGVAASEGRLLFMTTNHIDKLDAALIRPGRCDVKILFENADADQGRRMFLRFFPGEEALAESFGDLVGQGDYCMAAVQGQLLRYGHDPARAVSHFSEIVNEPQAANEVTERTTGELGVQATATDGPVAESEDVHQDDSGE